MKSFERISAILICFSSSEPQLRIDTLLCRTGIPTSSGYKLISDLVAEGLLRRVARGTVALGPSAAGLFYSPRRALMPVRGEVGLAGLRVASAPRKSHLESDQLNLVTTEQFRKEPPFTIGFANASSAHPWRMALERSLLGAARSQSDIVEQVVVRNAENDPVLQADQLLQMLDDGVDLCIISAAAEQNATLESSIAQLAACKMPLVGVDRFCGGTDDLVSFVTASDETVGRISALWLAERLSGAGRIVLLCGLETASPCKIRLEAARLTFERFPGIEIVAVEFTDWLAERGYQAVQAHLAAGWVPDGVWCDSGLQGIGSLNAFLDRGFLRGTIPPHTGGEMNLMYKMAIQERVPLCGLDYPAAMGAASFHVAIDALSGRPVPRVVETDMQVIVTRGHETTSVRADQRHLARRQLSDAALQRGVLFRGCADDAQIDAVVPHLEQLVRLQHGIVFCVSNDDLLDDVALRPRGAEEAPLQCHPPGMGARGIGKADGERGLFSKLLGRHQIELVGFEMRLPRGGRNPKPSQSDLAPDRHQRAARRIKQAGGRRSERHGAPGNAPEEPLGDEIADQLVARGGRDPGAAEQ
ncbi:MAG: substrate-binding domain-containing protein, partial [Pseudomonadota bacterium]